MARLYVVRHAHPDPTAGEAEEPVTWPLSETGRRAAVRLGRAAWWAGVGAVAASPERKAGQTAEMAVGGRLAVAVDADLREVGRPWVAGEGAFAGLAAAYLRGEPVPGWEPLAEARERFARAAGRALDRAGGAPAAVVTHGTVACAYLAGLAGAPADPATLWMGLPFAAVAVVDAEGGRLVAPFAVLP